MKISDIPKNHPYFGLSKDLDQILQPIKSLGFNHIGYQRVYNDGTFLDLDSKPHLLELFFIELKGLTTINYEKLINQPDGFEISLNSTVNSKAILAVREKFSIHHTLNLIKSHPNYVERLQFPIKSNNLQEFYYLNHLVYLKQFAQYFNEKAAKIIREAEKYKFKVRGEIERFDNISSELHKEKLNLRRFDLGKKYGYGHLTGREIECMQWLARGKSSAEIAALIGISHFTVNRHIENCKNKLRSYKQTYLIAKCLELGIIELE